MCACMHAHVCVCLLTHACTSMCVNVHMTQVKEHVHSLYMHMRPSVCSKLGLHLPHPVDHKNGKAQWNAKTESLHVTLRMVRDMDLFNF